jgi:mannosyltransferase
MPTKKPAAAGHLTDEHFAAAAPPITHWLRGIAIATSIIIVTLGLRVFDLSQQRFWLDEVFSATWAVQPTLSLLVAVLRFDIHPPLYYLQLHFWALISHSTLWLYLNSVFWSCLAVLALWSCGRRFLPPPAAVLATLLFAAMPAGVDWADNLRMYGMLGCLAIVAWFCCWRLFTAERYKGSGVALAVVLLALTYSHVAGFLFFGYAGAYALYLIGQNRPDRARVYWWVKVNLVSGILGLPAAANVLVRDTNHFSTLPSPRIVAETLGSLMAGPAVRDEWAAALAVAAGSFVVVSLLLDPRVRAVLVGFVATPICFAIVMSYLVQPIWLDRMFLFTTPFLALAVARGIFIVADYVGRISGLLARQIVIGGVTLLLLSGLIPASVWAATHDLKPTNFRAAAAEIRGELQPGDVVFIPDADTFWGIAWYLVGPDWGSPLRVQDPSDFSQKWVRILDRLGPLWRQRLDLDPTTRTLRYDGATLVIGVSIPAVVANATRVWLVNDVNNRHPFIKLPGFNQREQGSYRGLTVQLMTRG